MSSNAAKCTGNEGQVCLGTDKATRFSVGSPPTAGFDHFFPCGARFSVVKPARSAMLDARPLRIWRM
jgi:hypothetical protein